MTTSAFPVPARRRRERPTLPWWAFVAAGVGIVALALTVFTLMPPGSAAAPWWPASGLGVALVLAVAPRQLWLALVVILVANTIPNFYVDRPLSVAVAYGVANTVEALTVYLVLGSHRRRFALRTLVNAARFVLGAVLGACVVGLTVGIVAVTWAGTAFLPASLAASGSHLAAILLIAPFAALPRSLREPVPMWENITQTVLLAASLLVAFHPANELPLAFVPMTFLVWAALRQRPVVAFTQSLVTATLIFAARLFPDSFGGDAVLSANASVMTAVIYMSTIGIVMVLIIAARHEQDVAHAERLRVARAQLDAEREHAAALTTRLDLERQREDFVATTSHELRTPITSIAGYAELLADTGRLEDRERDWVSVIERNTARLAELVEDLLTLGSATAAGPRRGADSVDLRELAGEVIVLHRPLAAAQGVSLEDATTDAAAHGHSGDIRRVLINLVSNAIKFTPRGGTVTVSTERAGLAAAVTVADTGPGMSPDTLEHAFVRFYRGADAEQQSTPGTGLGLAIAQELAERNAGTVHLASPPSGGLIATLTLPATPGPPVSSRSGAT